MMVVQTLTTFALFGLIWMIQLVHYPTFRFVPEERFSEFHHAHTRGISVIVIPLMLSELGAAIWLAAVEPTRGVNQSILLGLTLVVWVSTFGLQVPCHNRLGKGKNQGLIEKLIATNWLRTLAWSAKAALLAWLMLSSGPITWV